MLGPVVGIVWFPRRPGDAKLLLTFAIAEPVKTHVNCFCLFWSDFSINNGIHHGIVSLEGSHGLFMSKFIEYDSDIHSFLSCDVKRCQFSFGCGCHDMLNDVSNVEDFTIVGWSVKCLQWKIERNGCLPDCMPWVHWGSWYCCEQPESCHWLGKKVWHLLRKQNSQGVTMLCP